MNLAAVGTCRSLRHREQRLRRVDPADYHRGGHRRRPRRGFGMPGIIVDGIDFFAVHEAAGEGSTAPARAAARAARVQGCATSATSRATADLPRGGRGRRDPRANRDCLDAFTQARHRGRDGRGGTTRRSTARWSKLIDEAVAEAKAAAAPTTDEVMTDVYGELLGKERTMARRITYQQAVNEALRQEMERDPTVVIMGEDIAGGVATEGEDDAWGGVLGVTKGLTASSPSRVLDTPISESAFIGAAAGAAASGLRPVAELMFVDFFAVFFDPIFNQAAKLRYMFGGKAMRRWSSARCAAPGIRAASSTRSRSSPIHPRSGPEGRTASHPVRRQGAAHSRSATTTRSSSSSTRGSTTWRAVPEEASRSRSAGEHRARGDDVTAGRARRMVNGQQAAAELDREGISSDRRPAHTSPLDPTRSSRRREHRPPGRRRRGQPALRLRRRHRRPGLRAGLRRAEDGTADGHAAAHPGPFSPVLEDAYVPSPDQIATAVREVAGSERAARA